MAGKSLVLHYHAALVWMKFLDVYLRSTMCPMREIADGNQVDMERLMVGIQGPEMFVRRSWRRWWGILSYRLQTRGSSSVCRIKSRTSEESSGICNGRRLFFPLDINARWLDEWRLVSTMIGLVIESYSTENGPSALWPNSSWLTKVTNLS